jgi:hypothetical protein
VRSSRHTARRRPRRGAERTSSNIFEGAPSPPSTLLEDAPTTESPLDQHPQALAWGGVPGQPFPPSVLFPDVFLRRRRANEKAAPADAAGGLTAREELAEALPACLARVGAEPVHADAWVELDPLGRLALAEISQALGLVVVCDRYGDRLL